MNQKISVSAFSKLAGLPKAEVYKIIKQDEFKDYVFTENGMFVIDTALLDALRQKKKGSEYNKPPEPESPVEANVQPTTASIILKAENEYLTQQLQEAHALIEQQEKQIQSLSLQLAEMASKSQEIAEKAINTVNQQQILTVAMAGKKIPWYKKLLGGGKNSERNI